MIPALLAAPLVEGVIGSVVGGVMNAFSPSAPAASTSSPFIAQLQRAAASLNTSAASSTAGTMQAPQWNQMSPGDAHTFLSSLSGRHVDATDASGRTFSGVVSGVSVAGDHPTLTIGNHIVSLSSLKQISWSTATV